VTAILAAAITVVEQVRTWASSEPSQPADQKRGVYAALSTSAGREPWPSGMDAWPT
jgi:hypothetical protein